MFQKELILIKQMHQKSVIFVIIGIIDKGFKCEPYLCNDCHDGVAIVSIKSSDYRIQF